MRNLGIVLIIAVIICVCCGFVYADVGQYSSYEFSFLLAWPWFSSALYMLVASFFCFAMADIVQNLKEIAANSKKMLDLEEPKKKKGEKRIDWSKSGDVPSFPRKEGETDMAYWERVSDTGFKV
jgi:hypothetical protein